MVTLADEIVAVAEQAGAWEDVANGLAFRYEIHLTRDEIRQAQLDLERHTRLAEELGLPSQIWHAATHGTELMLLVGRFTEAAACIDQALHRGMSAHPAEAMKTAVFQRLLLSCNKKVHSKSFGRHWRSWRPIDRTTKSTRVCSPGSIAN